MTLRTVLAMVALALVSGCATAPPPTATTFYPDPPETPRIQYVTTLNGQEDLRPTSAFRKFVVGGPRAGAALSRPWDVAHRPGRLYVIDKGLGGVLIFDLENKAVTALPDPKGLLAEPSGIFIDGDGNKYVADAGREAVLVFDRDDGYLRSYGKEGEFRPTDVAVFGDKIYVCDVRDEEVEVLDRKSGRSLGRIGRKGNEPGQFRFPTHLSLSDDGGLFVTDLLNFRVQQFDADGRFVKAIGEWGDFPGAMPRPKGIAVDRDGHLYAADAAFEMIQVFDVESARVLLPFAKFGPIGGSYLPSGVHIDYDNVGYFADRIHPDFDARYLIYVTNQAGAAKVNVYAFGEWTGGP